MPPKKKKVSLKKARTKLKKKPVGKSLNSKVTEQKEKRLWLEISQSAISHNINAIAKRVAPAEVMVVLKADAYGIGLKLLMPLFKSSPASRFGVAAVDEALEIRKLTKKPVQILGDIFPFEIEEAIKKNIILPVTSISSAKNINKVAASLNKKATCHILIDTGMGRLGIFYRDAKEEIEKILSLSNLKIDGLYSHFPYANKPANPKNKEQVFIFEKLKHALPEIKHCHMANSDGINNLPDSYYSFVRAGINIYGVFDLLGKHAYTLKPALSLKSKLISVRKLPRGATIGYACTHRLRYDTLVGTIPIGYADGLPMAASGKGTVLIQGIRCPIIGRISMDYTTVDLSKVPNVKEGTEVVLFGQSKKTISTVEEWARLKDTHPYDIICSLGKRVKRVLVP